MEPTKVEIVRTGSRGLQRCEDIPQGTFFDHRGATFLKMSDAYKCLTLQGDVLSCGHWMSERIYSKATITLVE